MTATTKLTLRRPDPAADLAREIDMDIAFLEFLSGNAEARGERHATRDLRLRAMLYQAKATALLAGSFPSMRLDPYRAADKAEIIAALRFPHNGAE